MNLESKFGYCMSTQTLNTLYVLHFVCKRDGIMDRQADGLSDY